MNERIRELREQAAKFAEVTYDNYTMATFNTNKSIETLFEEKFAELIVRECMKESMDEIVSDENIAQEKDPLVREYLKGNNQGIVDAVVRFRNHFGVTE
jgi:hypothetical protein